MNISIFASGLLGPESHMGNTDWPRKMPVQFVTLQKRNPEHKEPESFITESKDICH